MNAHGYSALPRPEIEAAGIPAFPFRLMSVKRDRRVHFSKALQRAALCTLIKHNGIQWPGTRTRCKKTSALYHVLGRANRSLWAWTRGIVRAQKKRPCEYFRDALWWGNVIRPRWLSREWTHWKADYLIRIVRNNCSLRNNISNSSEKNCSKIYIEIQWI